MNPHLVVIDNLHFPIFNFKRMSNLAIAPANIIGMAFGLFMIAAPMMHWIDFASPTLGACLCFGGICEYIFGILNWYEGRTIQSFIDFVFGFLHLTVFGTTELGKYAIFVDPYYHTYMQGTFYVIWLLMLLVVLISLKDRGFLYIINIFFLAVACVFVIVWEFSKKEWAEKAAGYFIFFACITLMVTALCQLLFANLHVGVEPFALPRP